jgi:predicted ATP-dependent serine protease
MNQSTPLSRIARKLVVKSDADAKLSMSRSYFLKGLFSPGELSVVYGEPGSGKSFLVLHIVRAINQERQVFGRRVRPTKVLYCALEGETGFEKRIQVAVKKYGEAAGFGYIAQSINLFSDDAAVNGLIEAILSHGAFIVVIDTLNRAMGGGSENDPGDMGKLIQVVDKIRAATGAHICIVHHCGKDASKGPRGHSALLGAADLVLEVTRSDLADTRTIKVIKAKDDPDGERHAFTLRTIDLGIDDDGDPITSCIVEEAAAPEMDKRKALTDEERQWLLELVELFARPDFLQTLKPETGMAAEIPCATRATVREWFKTRGLIAVAENVAESATGKGLSSTDRSKLQRILSRLKSKGKIGIYNDYIWLAHNDNN